jgi:hypothetical protein
MIAGEEETQEEVPWRLWKLLLPALQLGVIGAGKRGCWWWWWGCCGGNRGGGGGKEGGRGVAEKDR